MESLGFRNIVEQLMAYTVVLQPDEDTPEWWAGAPSVTRGPDGSFYLAARMREGNSPKGRRGYEIRILKSADGKEFKPVARLTREAARVPGFERPSIVFDPKSGRFRLYGCAGLENGWAIITFDEVTDPAEFNGETAAILLTGDTLNDGTARVHGYKDPFVFRDDSGLWHMFVIGTDFVERIHHFASEDGYEWWRKNPETVLENAGWHNFFTRPACVLPLQVGFLLVYEGSDYRWHDPVYNIATGLAYSIDLEHFHDLTPDTPLLRSSTPGDYHTWRYSHWLSVGKEVYVYFEATRPNNTNEIRMAVLHGTFWPEGM